MRILIITDAWTPQVNGVVRSLQSMAKAAAEQGAHIDFVTPQKFRTVPLPTYPDIRLALTGPRALRRRIAESQTDHVHIATEGPLGWAARSACLTDRRPFTTSYHTRFPEYLSARTHFPRRLSYALLRHFHAASIGTMVATRSIERELATRKFRNLMLWSRGVDHSLFYPRPATLDFPRPIFLHVGRLAVEKNVEAFLSLDLPGSKVLVGDGPARTALQARFSDAHFLGTKHGEQLAALYSSADVLVFPSRTDTFGLVMIEALACGVPVAAFSVPGPLDVIAASGAGILSDDLRLAALAALDIPRETARAQGATFTWERSAREFLGNIRHAHDRAKVFLVPAESPRRATQVRSSP